MMRVLLLAALLLPASLAGCLDAARDLAELGEDLADQFACSDEPRLVHEEEGRAVSPVLLPGPAELEEEGSAAITLSGENLTVITWALGRFATPGSANILYEARFTLTDSDGTEIWTDGDSGTADGFQAHQDVTTLAAGRYQVSWDVRGVGTEYRFRIEEAGCLGTLAYI